MSPGLVRKWVLCGAVAAGAGLLWPAVALAAPELGGATLRFGNSPRLQHGSWAYLTYQLRNPDSVPATVRLQLRPSHGEMEVFEKDIKLGANTALHGRELVVVAATENYELNLFQGTRKLMRTEIFARVNALGMHSAVFLLNDQDDEISGLSDLSKSPELLERVTVHRVPAADAPHHWLGYDNCKAVVIGAPDFRRLHARQLAALLDYVAHGGTAIFISPRGILASAETPLAELLPVTPFRIRRSEAIPELDRLGAAFILATGTRAIQRARQPLAAANGIELLESAPCGDGVTTLVHGDYPLCRWRRYGLGTVGVLAVNPATDLMRASGCSLPLWNHLLTWAKAPYVLGAAPNATLAPEIVARLTGFRIPPINVIRNILLAYGVALVLLLGAGVVLRIHVAAWLTAAVFGICLTVGIFVAAFRHHAQRAPQSLAVLEIGMATETFLGGHAVIGLFSNSDCRPTVQGTDPDTLLRALPTPRFSGYTQRGTMLPPPLIVRRTGNLVRSPDLNVQALKPRLVGLAYEGAPLPLAAVPRLVFGEEPVPRLSPWQLPAWVPGARLDAYLLFDGDFVRATVSGRECTLTAARGGMLRLNTLASDFERLFATRLLPNPCLALLQPWSATTGDMNVAIDGFERQGYSLRLIPVIQEVAAGPVSLGPALIRVDPPETSRHLPQQDGHWQEMVLRQPHQTLALTARVPPWLADLQVDELHLDMDVANPGENLLYEMAIANGRLSGSGKGDAAEMLWSTATKPTRHDALSFHFTGLQQLSALDPLTGTMTLLLRISQKRLIQDSLQTERANAWKVNSLRVTAHGILNCESGKRRF